MTTAQADINNEDWIKGRTWDIWVPGHDHLVGTVPELTQAVGNVKHFLTLPAARAMPPALRAAVQAAGLFSDPVPETVRVPRVPRAFKKG